MKIRELLEHLSRLLSKSLTLGVLAFPLVQLTSVQPISAQSFTQINKNGFGDRENSWAWSMAWFKEKLYVGTNRNFPCVQLATVDFYFPNSYTPNPDPDVPCPPTPKDLNLQAEIWRYTPETDMWEQVFQSPNDVPIPDAPGNFVSRDIGFRDMVVFTESDGTEALYVAGVTAREHLPGLPPPRILRSTDGKTFKPIPQDPGTVLGDLSAIGFRVLTTYKGRLYVTATTGLFGLGAILEAEHPAKGNNNFRQVSPPDLNVFELSTFNGFLYVGAGDDARGYSVWKTEATGTSPYRFIPVVTDGAGRGSAMMVVVSMHPFQESLYVGSSGPQTATVAELIRVNSDDSWDLVVGNPRLTPQGNKFPISGLPDSFGNPFNIHFWRMQEHNGELYLGTYDASFWLRVLPWLDPFIKHEYGFDLYKTKNGREWVQLSRDGLGNKFNVGVRTFASTPLGLFLGTANDAFGTEIWLGTGEDSRKEMPVLSGVPSAGFHIFSDMGIAPFPAPAATFE